MTWSDLSSSFILGGTVTASGTNAIHTNILAACSGASGAPRFQNAAFVTSETIDMNRPRTSVYSNGSSVNTDTARVYIDVGSFSFMPSLTGNVGRNGTSSVFLFFGSRISFCPVDVNSPYQSFFINNIDSSWYIGGRGVTP